MANPVSQDAGADGIVSIEAEDFDENIVRDDPHTWEFSTEIAGFSGSGFMQAVPDNTADNTLSPPEEYLAGPELVFQIKFVKTGIHYIWTRTQSANANADSLHAGLNGDGTTADRIQPPKQYDGNWYWGNERRDDQGRAQFDVPSTGVHTVHIWMREDGILLDKLVLTTNADYTPEGLGPPASHRTVKGKAQNPSPSGEDVPRDGVILSWTPSELAVKHNVYFGTVFDDVNNADNSSPLLVSPGQILNTYDPPDRLEFGKTYYWRIDEIAADGMIHKGDVWSFTVEPLAYPIEDIIATASSSNTADEGSENTINSSGLNGNFHSTVLTDMWFTAIGEPTPAWIQYDFGKAYKLHEMLVWNYNGPSFLTAVGMKDVVVEYSSDGTDLVQIDSVSEFARASGLDDYTPNTTVPLDGILAKIVKISASSNWSGGFSDQFGLSEVQILHIPVNAREPSPASGATDVDVDVVLGWRAGREAASHDVYISDDPDALTLTDSVDQPSFDTASQTLALGQTYHWRIDEVNDAETPTTWPSDVWSFTTTDYLVVDDFEDYDLGNKEIWWIWKDGLGYAAVDNRPAYPGNGTGSAVGDETSPSYMEESIVNSGTKSMPVAYNNSTATTSEIIVQTSDLSIGQNWTKGAAQTLVLWFYGDPANTTTEWMYVKINGEKVNYPGDAEDITRPIWQQWNIDLAALSIDQSNVTELIIGFERTDASGGSGKVLIDDIRLYRSAPSATSEQIWLEAETATTMGASWRLFDDTGASGGKYLGSEDGDGDDNNSPPGSEWLATYDFTVNGGVYKIIARIITSPGNSFWFRIQGATSEQITRGDGWINTNPMEGGDTWHWDEIHNDEQNDNIVYFTLPAGQHTLEIAKREDGTLLDVVLITSQLE
jgi:hypothetical protein